MKNNILKFTFLIAILAIPVVIFLFLKSFGKNQFMIPIYHTEGAGNKFTECNYPADTFRVAMNNRNDKKANVTIFFKETTIFDASDLVNTEARLQALFNSDFSFIAHGEPSKEDTLYNANYANYRELMHCSFVTDTINQFILHDEGGRIRGYYNTSLEEVDRLIVETKILLENE